ncbi:MAG: hypothetical protein IPL27_27870 [Lewinellaceae bacterium]|nr:hypothetical protein [Lewinellaceae bacterium]
MQSSCAPGRLAEPPSSNRKTGLIGRYSGLHGGDLEACSFQRRFEILGVDRIKIDVLTATVRHGHENV